MHLWARVYAFAGSLVEQVFPGATRSSKREPELSDMIGCGDAHSIKLLVKLHRKLQDNWTAGIRAELFEERSTSDAVAHQLDELGRSLDGTLQSVGDLLAVATSPLNSDEWETGRRGLRQCVDRVRKACNAIRNLDPVLQYRIEQAYGTPNEGQGEEPLPFNARSMEPMTPHEILYLVWEFPVAEDYDDPKVRRKLSDCSEQLFLAGESLGIDCGDLLVLSRSDEEPIDLECLGRVLLVLDRIEARAFHGVQLRLAGPKPSGPVVASENAVSAPGPMGQTAGAAAGELATSRFSDIEEAVIRELRKAARPLAGKELANRLKGHNGGSEGNLTRHVLPRLKNLNLVGNRRGAGYFLIGE